MILLPPSTPPLHAIDAGHEWDSPGRPAIALVRCEGKYCPLCGPNARAS